MALCIEPVDSFVRQIVRKPQNAQIISSFDRCGSEFKIAQKGNCLLANSGVKTGFMEIKPTTTENDVMQFLLDTARQQLKFYKKGIKMNA